MDMSVHIYFMTLGTAIFRACTTFLSLNKNTTFISSAGVAGKWLGYMVVEVQDSHNRIQDSLPVCC